MASLPDGASPACLSKAPMPSGAPLSVSSGMSSGTPPLARSWKSCSAASAAAALWKRAVIYLASSTLASFGLRPPSTSRFKAAISASGRNDSSVKYFHIITSLTDSSLANMLLAGSVMAM